ncbi:cytochrome-c peroxidase [Sphingobacteriales bacterium UPWRP_1]|nr:hypothetical protein BVG80_04685 [Sphingobacteriales bacterium TSM_CSM]PSJ73684.1 cytochrome-c peroxidase [Sphingobacteriales bacterium UPWRP_1]
MKNNAKIALFFLISPLFAFIAFDYECVNLPETLLNYAGIVFPADIINNLADMDNMPASNPTTDAGATLGRVLFYDADLSQNHTISCASCHIQEFSFTDTARFSTGFNGGQTTRNAMSINHIRFQRDNAFFWDERAPSLEAQALMPIQNAVEMGLTLDTLVARVAAKPFYPSLFQAAFGTTTVTSDFIARALAQFMRSMNTFGSKYRQGVEQTPGNPSVVPFANFTAEENLGKTLFMDTTRGNCQSCHTRNVFVHQGSHNIGLDIVYADNGVGAVTGNPNKNGKFAVPSLINVALTAPYMHDGRYNTLEQVINFYSDSIQPHPNLSHFLKDNITGLPRHPNYTPSEKAALLAFLNTLTDTIIATDERWSNPFCVITCVPTITGNAEVCAYDPVTYTITPGPPNSTYLWNITGSYIIVSGCSMADTTCTLMWTDGPAGTLSVTQTSY